MWEAWTLGLDDALQIAILAAMIYGILRLVRGTRSAQVLLGLGVVLTLLGLTVVLNLDVLGWLLGALSVYLAVSLVVIFQPEIRRALAMLAAGDAPSHTVGVLHRRLCHDEIQLTVNIERV